MSETAPWYVTRDRLTDAEFQRIEEYMDAPVNPDEPQLADRFLRMMYQEWRATQWERNEAQDKLKTNPPAIIHGPQWIPVSASLPEPGTNVLVYVESLEVVCAACFDYWGLQRWFDNSNTQFDEGDITHWMPLPEPPSLEQPTKPKSLSNEDMPPVDYKDHRIHFALDGDGYVEATVWKSYQQPPLVNIVKNISHYSALDSAQRWIDNQKSSVPVMITGP